MRSRIGVCVAAVLALTVPALAAQEHRPGDDVLARAFFPPDLVLRYAEEIGLKPEQRNAIVNLMKETHVEMLELQLAMNERSGKLEKELRATAGVNETAVLALVDSVLATERSLKRRQMQLLIRIRNLLSREQHDRLHELRKAHGTESMKLHHPEAG